MKKNEALKKFIHDELKSELIEEKGVKVIRAEGVVDDALLEYASGQGAVVGTNDRELKGRLQGAGELYQQPRNDGVGHANAYNIPALELAVERHCPSV